MEILTSIGSCLHDITTAYGLPLSLLLAGLVGSVTHCVFMCGPFVLSQTGEMTKIRDIALIPYHLGRMTTYLFMAFLAYSVLSLVFVYSDAKAILAAPLLFIAGVIFLVSAFPKLSALFPWVGRLSMPIKNTYISKAVSTLGHAPTLLRQYMMGVLLGFMPCGLVIAAIIASMSATSLSMALTSMAAFTIGTVPTLIAVALGGSSLKHKYPKFSLRFSQTAKFISACWLFALAGILIL